MPEQLFSYQKLSGFTKSVFQKIGCSVNDADIATKVLLSADLRGIDSHGVARLTGYVRLWEVKRVNTDPSIKILHETPSTAVVDGDSGLGLVVAPHAMNIAIEKAKNVGTGWVSVQNSNHFGIAGYHAMMALQHDMIGIAFTNASALDSRCPTGASASRSCTRRPASHRACSGTRRCARRGSRPTGANGCGSTTWP